MKRTKVSSVSSTKGSRWRQHQVSAGSAGSDLERVDVADANEARVVQNKVVEIEPSIEARYERIVLLLDIVKCSC